MHTVIPIVSAERNCDGCTVCCDGWLTGKANEHYFYPGQKCYYVSDNGCTIYEDRPEIPCKTFSCGWLLDKEIPEWMKPSNIQAVIILYGDRSFKIQRETVSLKVFSWLKRLYRQGKIKTIQSEEEFLLEIKQAVTKYGKYLMLLDIEELNNETPENSKIMIDSLHRLSMKDKPR
jgi:hypothetical protein